MGREVAVCGLLLLAVAAVFGQTLGHEFLNYDDDKYVCQNPQVVGGLTVEGVQWAFTSRHAANWHPLTWLSHMLDCQLFGLAPWGHHLTNILLHAAATIVLFQVLRRMTDDLWPSAFVAAVFAIHPLRVESVAWVAERKDVLSGLFFMLSLAAYSGYVRRPFSLARYLAVMALFALGLMAKPMLVTLPFVLLLLDYWPLRRLASGARPLVEKIPLLALSAASCTATLWAQQQAIAASEHVALGWRLGNAAVSYVAYLVQSACPAGLAVLYPHPGSNLPLWKVAGALAALAALCGGAVAWRRRCPYLLVGWLWYSGTLLPVIGLLQVGLQARADRYTYLPQIGLSIALAWGAAQLSRSWPNRAWACGAASALALTALLGCAWRQTCYWRNSETLWPATLARTGANPIAEYNFGSVLAERGRLDEAGQHYRRALEFRPDYTEAHYNLAVVLAKQGRDDEAIEHYGKALEIAPDFSEAHNNLGVLLAAQGRIDEAISHYRKAVEIVPNFDAAYNNLGNALANRGQNDEAIVCYRKALKVNPKYAEAHNNLGVRLQAEGKLADAKAEYQNALAIKPDYAEAHNNLGVALGQQGKLAEAIVHFHKALQINPRYEAARQNLIVTLRRQGSIPNVVLP